MKGSFTTQTVDCFFKRCKKNIYQQETQMSTMYTYIHFIYLHEDLCL